MMTRTGAILAHSRIAQELIARARRKLFLIRLSVSTYVPAVVVPTVVSV